MPDDSVPAQRREPQKAKFRKNSLDSVHPEMLDCGSGQGRSDFALQPPPGADKQAEMIP
jgi:hypothetical protein